MIRLLIAFLLLFPCTAFADTHVAASCSKADVETAIAAASNGDTVEIPTGTCSWASDVSVAKQITLAGKTTTSRNGTTYVVTPSDSTIIQTSGVDVSSAGVRITGITFDSQSSVVIDFSSGSATGSRVDNCHFDTTGRVFTKGNLSGLLVDNNLFEDQSSDEPFYFGGDGNDAWTDGNTYGVEANWLLDIEFTNTGGDDSYISDSIIFEDNEFRLTASAPDSAFNLMDMGEGARVILRYNRFQMHSSKIWQYVIESHGHCWGFRDGTDNAGTYLVEIYNNIVDSDNETEPEYISFFRPRGGRGYVYNNTLEGSGYNFDHCVYLRNDEVTTEACNSTPCAVQAHEDNGWHTVPLSEDPNYTDGLCDDYPCAMQINNFYVWDNTADSGTFNLTSEISTTFYTEDRDYWDDLGGGDTNFSSGASGSRGGTCTDDDCYWETDTGKLYRCDGTNNWELVYEQYDYPHPLRGEGGNLRGVTLTGASFQ